MHDFQWYSAIHFNKIREIAGKQRFGSNPLFCGKMALITKTNPFYCPKLVYLVHKSIPKKNNATLRKVLH